MAKERLASVGGALLLPRAEPGARFQLGQWGVAPWTGEVIWVPQRLTVFEAQGWFRLNVRV